jgi:ubiquitin-conjugating enzyme E2 J1
METDPKGQLGGLECTDDMRRRMAKASRTWKCTSCGKCNEEILKACEEAAKLTDTKPDETVPKELKMGWKDEMVKEGNAAASNDEDCEGAELAEGFVQTAGEGQSSQAQTATVSMTSPPARPVQGVPQPTATTTVPPRRGVQAAAQRVRQRSNDGVPTWVDGAIVGILACLIAMILKQFL